jgi:hypothetical protein
VARCRHHGTKLAALWSQSQTSTSRGSVIFSSSYLVPRKARCAKGQGTRQSQLGRPLVFNICCRQTARSLPFASHLSVECAAVSHDASAAKLNRVNGGLPAARENQGARVLPKPVWARVPVKIHTGVGGRPSRGRPGCPNRKSQRRVRSRG